MKLDDTGGKTVDLLGAGIDNTALLPHLTGASAIRVWVDDPHSVPADVAAVYSSAGVPIGAVADWECGQLVVRSPGFPRYRSDIAAVLAECPPGSVTTAVNLWLETYGDRYPTVIVTGTKGKSTVARMLASVLPGSELVGNIGEPIWDLVPPEDPVPIVVEVSSYQAVDMTYRPTLGILTSLSEDHVSWHGSVDRYHRDKLKPLHAADRVQTQPALLPLFGGHSDARAPEPENRVVASDDLPGHMAANASLAVAAARWLADDLGVAVVPDPVATIRNLPPLVGRLREIRVGDEHRWFDDSLASNPSGAAAAIAAFASDHLWLIVGGIDRHVSPQPLLDALLGCDHPVSVVAVPNNGGVLIEQMQQAGVVIDQRVSAANVQRAVAEVRARARGRSTVLFSPAAPTPPQHGNWADRSAAFEAAVVEQLHDPR